VGAETTCGVPGDAPGGSEISGKEKVKKVREMDKKDNQRNIDERLINEIPHRILGVVNPTRIILFGSAATGTMNFDSDFDLLVIEDDFANQREENLQLRKALHGLGMPVDIFAMTSERFDETRDVIGGLAYPANKYGKVIYEKS